MDLFGTAGIRGPVADHLTPELALAVGQAVAADGDDVVVARDGRVTGHALATAVAAGLSSGGVSSIQAGKLPTPALAFASRGRRGVMLTASHNPPTDNGIKCFVDGREYDRDAERRIEARVDAEPNLADWDTWGTIGALDVIDQYVEAVVEYIGTDKPLDELSVVVDCGNGMGSLATPQVLESLGAHVVALNANVDGHFPGRESKPTPESMHDLRAFVADGEFDFGLAHDGDADRIAVVDADGEVVHEDTVLAIIAAQYVRDSNAADPVVVTTPNASGRIDERVDDAGGRIERVRLGALHEGIDTAREAGDETIEIVFAAEPWKHVHVPFGEWIDGVVSAAVFSKLVAAHGLDALCEAVNERPYRKVSVACSDTEKPRVMNALETALPAAFPDSTVITDHGVRLELPDASWLLVRPSGTEPYVRIYAESDDVDALVETTRGIVAAVRDDGPGLKDN